MILRSPFTKLRGLPAARVSFLQFFLLLFSVFKLSQLLGQKTLRLDEKILGKRGSFVRCCFCSRKLTAWCGVCVCV